MGNSAAKNRGELSVRESTQMLLEGPATPEFDEEDGVWDGVFVDSEVSAEAFYEVSCPLILAVKAGAVTVVRYAQLRQSSSHISCISCSKILAKICAAFDSYEMINRQDFCMARNSS